MKSECSFEPHLVINEVTLPPAAEWRPRRRGWLFMQMGKGVGYWQHPQAPLELCADSVLVLTEGSPGVFLASQLGEVIINYFCLEPEKLTELLSLSEQQSLGRVAARQPVAVRILAPNDPVSERFKRLCRNPGGGNLFVRLQLLQLFLDLLKGELNGKPVEPPLPLDGRNRLRKFLQQTAAGDLLELSLSDLVPQMHVSPRHLSRLFREELGMSFREKQTELRLAKACQLLATTDVKLIEVALASGYQSNSLFNLMFKKRFGVSPGKWRRQNHKKAWRRQKSVRLRLV